VAGGGERNDLYTEADGDLALVLLGKASFDGTAVSSDSWAWRPDNKKKQIFWAVGDRRK
jgi:hypothetical protein